MQDLTSGNLNRHLLKTASFMLVTMVFQTLYFLIDLYWVGRLGTDAVAAVGIAGNLTFINLALTPEATFNLWTTFSLPWDFTFGGGAQYMDTVFRNTTNTTSVPSYWLVNTMASYKVNEGLTLRLNGQNLADIEYVDRVGGGHYIPGPRRQLILNADFSF